MATVKARVFPTPTVSSTELNGSLPNVDIDETVDFTAVAKEGISRLEDLSQDDLTTDALWKDSLCMTGDQRTFYSSASIITAWKELLPQRRPKNFCLIPYTARVFRPTPQSAWITASFLFETEGKQASKCSGMLNLVPEKGGNYKIWALATLLEGGIDQLGFPEQLPDPSFQPSPDAQGYIDCIIIGGGMSGVCAAGRLHALKVPYVVIEGGDEVGDSWMRRYDSVKLHLNNSYSEMPFKRMYTDKPYYLTKNDLAEGMRNFVDMHQIQVWLSSWVQNAHWDPETHSWTVKILRKGNEETLKTKHLVMAIGGGVDKPNIPEYRNRESFRGKVVHSVDWKNAGGLQGKRGVIVGCANSAFDIAQDMVDSGLSSVTMLQRSKTLISSHHHVRTAMDQLFNPGMDLNLADRIAFAPPYAIGRLLAIATTEACIAKEPDQYAFLEKAGFQYEQTPDLNAGPIEGRRGHVLDVGGLSLIERGEITIVSGTSPNSYTTKGLQLANGTELEADVIVLATGFRKSLRKSVGEIVGSEIADQLDEYGGFTAEGELRGLARPIGHPGIWYMCGGTAQARYLSRYLALQIQADVKGVPFEPYERFT